MQVGQKQSGAAQVLGQIGTSRAVEPLIACLRSENPVTRQTAIQALGQIKDSRAIEPLIAALKDTSPDIRLAVVQALGQINDPRVVKPLISALSDDDVRIRDSAILALKTFKDQRYSGRPYRLGEGSANPNPEGCNPGIDANQRSSNCRTLDRRFEGSRIPIFGNRRYRHWVKSKIHARRNL